MYTKRHQTVEYVCVSVYSIQYVCISTCSIQPGLDRTGRWVRRFFSFHFYITILYPAVLLSNVVACGRYIAPRSRLFYPADQHTHLRCTNSTMLLLADCLTATSHHSFTSFFSFMFITFFLY